MSPKLSDMQLVESLPLFPLADVVLLPDSSVPLFVFEPRYRQMTREAMAGERQIGMVAVRPEGVTAMAGDPPIFQIGCLGRITHAQQRPDGTFHILLTAHARFRILEELPRAGERLYRSARVALLEESRADLPEQRERLAAQRRELLVLLQRFVQALGPAVDDPSGALASFERLEPRHLANVVAQSISFHPVERQRLLEVDGLVDRYEMVSDLLRFKLAELGSGETAARPLLN